MREQARLLAAGAVMVGLCVGLGAQQTPPATPPPPATQPQRPPVIRSGINFVSVDVIVTDKKTGEVVLDMKTEDFEVREDKKPQKVDTFEIVKIDELASNAITPKAILSMYDEESEAKQPNVRLFILLLDDYHVRRGNDMASRKPLIDFVQNQLAPQDMVAVMYPMTPISGLTFTRNRDSLIQSITHFQGRKGIYEPQNEFEEKYAYYPVQTVENIRNDVTMGALKGAAIKLGGMREGRKSIIFVSEGLTSTVPAQINDPVAAMPGVNNPNRGATGVDQTNNPRAESQKFFDSADLTNRIKETFDTVNRNNCSIYAVDPRGLAVFEYDINQGVGLQTDRVNLNQSIDSLRVLAENTDGRAIVNRNDLAAGMKQIVRDSSAYYLVGYSSTIAPSDGKFHEIKVKVKRPGVQVRARKGYWALTAEETSRALAPPKPGPAPAVTAALANVASSTRTRLIRTWIGTSRGENGKTKVTFVWEPTPRSPGDRATPGDQPSRVSVMAVGADGAPSFRGRVPDVAIASLSPGSPGSAGVSNAADGGGTPRGPSRVVFEIAPGKMQLRLAVEGAGAGVLDSEVRDIVVPDLTSSQTSLGTPVLFRARTPREIQQLKADPQAVPATTREFSRTDRVFMRVAAYGAGAPALSIHMLNRAGQSMSELPVTSPGSPGVDAVVDVPLAGVAPGDYIIEVKATGEGGEAKELIGFRVTS
jgi:VWFA-related protein